MKSQSWPVVILAGYLFGGVINHALMLGRWFYYVLNSLKTSKNTQKPYQIIKQIFYFTAVHETAHGAAFGIKYPTANKWFGIFANLPIGLPFSVAFKGYHLEHHRVTFHSRRNHLNQMSLIVRFYIRRMLVFLT